MRKIIIIGHEPLTARNKSCFFIDAYRERGLSVAYWDASSYFYPGMSLQGEIQDAGIRKFNSLQAIESGLKNIDTEEYLFIVEVNECWENRHFFKLLARYRCYEIYIDMYGNSVLPASPRDKIRKILSKNIGTTLQNHMVQFLYKWYKKIHGYTSYRRLFSSSDLIAHTDKINHPDYESFRELSDPTIQPVVQGKYIVFIDTFFPFHPDLKFIYKIKESDGKAYRASLNRFFAYLERIYQMPVVIAAHPKADYRGNEFEGRRIVKLETNKLVAFSEIVVLHASNAISYAVLGNKKLAFITTREYNASPVLSGRIKQLAGVFNKEVYDIDSPSFERIDVSEIDPKCRENYIYTYLTFRETEKKKNIDILLAAFSSL